MCHSGISSASFNPSAMTPLQMKSAQQWSLVDEGKEITVSMLSWELNEEDIQVVSASLPAFLPGVQEEEKVVHFEGNDLVNEPAYGGVGLEDTEGTTMDGTESWLHVSKQHNGVGTGLV